jgi:hypothetical protein
MHLDNLFNTNSELVLAYNAATYDFALSAHNRAEAEVRSPTRRSNQPSLESKITSAIRRQRVGENFVHRPSFP